MIETLSSESVSFCVFAYSPDDNVGEISTFIECQKDFLKDYAKENDVPFVVFGD